MSGRTFITERQRLAARYLLDGMSGFRALMRAGYARSSARKLGWMQRGSRGLREAVAQEREKRHHSWNPAPQRRRKYDRRAVVNAIYTAEHSRSNTQRRFEDATETCPMCRKLVSKKKLLMDPSGREYVCENCVNTHFGRFS